MRAPPLPIPNREVKPHCADGTAIKWESRSPPLFFLRGRQSTTKTDDPECVKRMKKR